jgi:nitrite reductase/ring-hydroxylating ferredoxin subunit
MDPEFITVGRVADVPAGGMAAFDVAGTSVTVANVNGVFHAFDDTCTHELCSLADGELEGQKVICPCHQGEFDVTTGEVLAPPPAMPIKTYRVRTAGDALQIALR